MNSLKLFFSLRVATVVAVPLFLAANASAQAPTPTPHPLVSAQESIFSNKGEANLSAVENEAASQKTAAPFYKSNGVETRSYAGYFKAAADTSKLALLSDDGTSVRIDGEQVLNRAGQGQGFDQKGAVTFYPLSKTFVKDRVYFLELQYTNTIHSSDADVDGLSLWAYDGGGEIVDPPIDVDMDVDNTTMNGYPNAANGDRSKEEEEAEATQTATIWANLGDDNSNEVPNFADGIDIFGNGTTNACRNFEPLLIDSTVTPNGRYVFRYTASDPNLLTRSVANDGEVTYSLPNSNILRVWKKDGPASRSPLSAHQGGDFLAPNQPYSAQELGLTTGTTQTFFVEMLDASDRENPLTITVEFYPSGISPSAPMSQQILRVAGYEFGTFANPNPNF